MNNRINLFQRPSKKGRGQGTGLGFLQLDKWLYYSECNLSLDALGMLGFLLSVRDWHLDMSWLEERFGIGKSKRKKIFDELVEKGFLTILHLDRDNYVYEVCELPDSMSNLLEDSTNPYTENLSEIQNSENQTSDFQTSENQTSDFQTSLSKNHLISKNQLTRNNQNKSNNKKQLLSNCYLSSEFIINNIYNNKENNLDQNNQDNFLNQKKNFDQTNLNVPLDKSVSYQTPPTTSTFRIKSNDKLTDERAGKSQPLNLTPIDPINIKSEKQKIKEQRKKDIEERQKRKINLDKLSDQTDEETRIAQTLKKSKDADMTAQKALDKVERAEKIRKTKQHLAEKRIKRLPEFTNNSDVLDLLIKYTQMISELDRPFTDTSFYTNIQHLFELSDKPQEQVAIIKNSLAGNYPRFYFNEEMKAKANLASKASWDDFDMSLISIDKDENGNIIGSI